MGMKHFFEIGDLVDTHSGEQGIVVEILDDTWVNILQCNGHVEKTTINDIWKSDTEVDGKAALHNLFMNVFGYSSVYEEPCEDAEISANDFALSEGEIPY